MPDKIVTVIINGRKYSAIEGEPILNVARRNGVFIPSLCYEESLEPYGACRMCIVEVKSEHTRKKITPSCTLYCQDGLSVETDSEEVLKHRRLLLELYLAQAPNSEKIKKLAKKYGVETTRFRKKIRENDPLNNSCVLCGLCVRVCNEIMEAGVINFIGRGHKTTVNTPYYENSDVCLGCMACAEVCPTGAISFEDKKGVRIAHSWSETRIELKKCSSCGKYFAPDKLDRKVDAVYSREDYAELKDLCPDCRRKYFTNKISLITANEVEKYAKKG